MRNKMTLIIGAVAGIAGLSAAVAVGAAALGSAAGGGSAPMAGPPAISDPTVPSMPQDGGVGEQLLLVVANGTYRTQADAAAASQAFSFGEMQGFYEVQVGQFTGLRGAVGGTGAWVLASAFRTRDGAEQFAELARSAGAKVTITPRVVSLPGDFAGLGQEARPDGTGPLSTSVPASAANGGGSGPTSTTPALPPAAP